MDGSFCQFKLVPLLLKQTWWEMHAFMLSRSHISFKMYWVLIGVSLSCIGDLGYQSSYIILVIVHDTAHQTRWSGRNCHPISAEIALPRLQSEIKVALFLFASISFLANNLRFMVKLIDKAIVINLKKAFFLAFIKAIKKIYLVETKVSQQLIFFF